MGGAIISKIMIDHPIFNEEKSISGSILAAPAISIIDQPSSYFMSTFEFLSQYININVPFTSEDVKKNTRVPSEQKRYIDHKDNFSDVNISLISKLKRIFLCALF